MSSTQPSHRFTAPTEAAHRRPRALRCWLAAWLVIQGCGLGTLGDPQLAHAQAASGDFDQSEILNVLDAIAAKTPSEALPTTSADEHAPAPPERVSWSKQDKKALAQSIDEVLARDTLKKATAAVLVVDAESGDVLYSKNADKMLKPASNAKLITSAAALDLLGEDYRFATRVYADGKIDAKGVLDGNLVIVGQHDFTWSSEFYSSSSAPLNAIADALYAQGLRKVKGKVVAMGEFQLGGDNFGSFDPSAHRSSALSTFRKALNNKGVKNEKGESSSSFQPPKGATTLYTWTSPPLSVACIPLNRKSHNEFADALMRHLGYVVKGKSSYESGLAAVKDWLGDAKIASKGLEMHDGSGLSHDNRASAKQLVAITLFMAQRPAGEAWQRSLAEAGVSGTYRGRLKGDDTRGRTFLKSGTLRDTIGSSGILVNRHDGRSYIFAVLLNDVGKRSGRSAADAIVSRLGQDWLGLGARPAAPTLLSVLREGEKTRIRWTAVDGVVGYWLWLSRDGVLWQRAEAVYTEKTEAELSHQSMLFVRLSAVTKKSESDPSDTYVARPASAGQRRILLVDANDSWQEAPARENFLGWGHAFVPRLALAIDGAALDSCADEALATLELGRYDVVLWSAGEDQLAQEVLSTAQGEQVRSYLDAGGRLLLSASYLDAVLLEQSWLGEALQVGSDSVETSERVLNQGTGAAAGVGPVSTDARGIFAVERSTAFSKTQETKACLSYAGGTQPGCVQSNGKLRMVALGFPVEAIRTLEDRKALLTALLSYL